MRATAIADSTNTASGRVDFVTPSAALPARDQFADELNPTCSPTSAETDVCAAVTAIPIGLTSPLLGFGESSGSCWPPTGPNGIGSCASSASGRAAMVSRPPISVPWLPLSTTGNVSVGRVPRMAGMPRLIRSRNPGVETAGGNMGLLLDPLGPLSGRRPQCGQRLPAAMAAVREGPCLRWRPAGRSPTCSVGGQLTSCPS